MHIYWLEIIGGCENIKDQKIDKISKAKIISYHH